MSRLVFIFSRIFYDLFQRHLNLYLIDKNYIMNCIKLLSNANQTNLKYYRVIDEAICAINSQSRCNERSPYAIDTLVLNLYDLAVRLHLGHTLLKLNLTMRLKDSTNYATQMETFISTDLSELSTLSTVYSLLNLSMHLVLNSKVCHILNVIRAKTKSLKT